jgi:hypothetical protein
MYEKWKDIQGFENRYQVSDKGNVRALNFKRTGQTKLLKLNVHCGYYYVNLYEKGKYKTFRVHRLMALAFIENPQNKPFINHKDGNKLNNSLENLEWCTPKENTIHALKTGLAQSPKPRYGKANHKTKGVNQYSLDGQFVKHWDCIRDAEKAYKAHHISAVCKGQRETCKGFKWEYEVKENG